jgi:hypothetical protein
MGGIPQIFAKIPGGFHAFWSNSQGGTNLYYCIINTFFKNLRGGPYVIQPSTPHPLSVHRCQINLQFAKSNLFDCIGEKALQPPLPPPPHKIRRPPSTTSSWGHKIVRNVLKNTQSLLIFNLYASRCLHFKSF